MLAKDLFAGTVSRREAPVLFSSHSLATMVAFPLGGRKRPGVVLGINSYIPNRRFLQTYPPRGPRSCGALRSTCKAKSKLGCGPQFRFLSQRNSRAISCRSGFHSFHGFHAFQTVCVSWNDEM